MWVTAVQPNCYNCNTGSLEEALSEETSLKCASGTPSVTGMTKRDPFKYFKTSPELIRLAVMMYVRYPLSLRNVEDLLHERGHCQSKTG